MRKLLLLSLMAGLGSAACDYDLVIRNGHVIDAANRRDGRMDVAIAKGKIAKVETGIAVEAGCKTVDAMDFLPFRKLFCRFSGRDVWLRYFGCGWCGAEGRIISGS